MRGHADNQEKGPLIVLALHQEQPVVPVNASREDALLSPHLLEVRPRPFWRLDQSVDRPVTTRVQQWVAALQLRELNLEPHCGLEPGMGHLSLRSGLSEHFVKSLKLW